jgi:hypothetical protein
MSRIDLFKTADANCSKLEDSLQKAVAAAGDPGGLRRFGDRIKADGRVSINLRPSTLVAFFNAGTHQNIYEWAAEMSGLGGVPQDHLLREHLGRYYESRLAFDASIEMGTKLRYGALNIGGMGATNYGDCCLVMSAPAAEKASPAYLPSDSLQTYVRGVAVDRAGIARDVAPHSHRAHTATLKHERDVSRRAEPTWPLMVCSNAGYVEAIFIPPVLPDHVAAVRMRRADHERYFDFAFNDLHTRLSDAERAQIDVFRILLLEMRKRRIPLEVLDD